MSAFLKSVTGLITDDSPVLVVLVGMPAAGKSTFRDKYGDDMIIVSSDDFVEDKARERGKDYDEVFQQFAKEANKSCQETFQRACGSKSDIMWDQTNLSPNKRRKILSQLPTVYTTVCVYFEVEKSVLDSRHSERSGKCIPDNILKSMWESYVRPDESEGFDFVLNGVEDFA